MSDDKLTPKGEDEVRAEVIEKYELYEDLNEDLVDKLTQDQLELQKKEFEAQKTLSKTIEQKAKYREIGVKAGLLDPETFEPIERADAKTEKKQDKEESKANDSLTKEEVVLFAKGFEEEDLDKLKFIQAGYKATGKEISLKDAQQDEMFVAYLNNKEAKQKSEKAQLGTSSGGGFSADKEGKPLTRDEHKKMWEKANR